MLLSIVVPCKNEENGIFGFLAEMTNVIDQLQQDNMLLQAEILFVDDGSADNTLDVIKSFPSTSLITVRWISLSRNFGKEAAIAAGLDNARGDYVALIDADLQDPPTLLLSMWDAINNDVYDMVVARRRSRKGEPALRSWFAKCFYKLFHKLTGIELLDGERDYRLMNRKVVDSSLQLGERNRFSKGLFAWVGYNVKYLEYEYISRNAGVTKWSFSQLVKYAFDAITSFSSAPLLISSVFGLVLCIGAFIALLVIVIRAALFGDPVAGWPSMMSIILLLGGLQFLFLGAIGQYVAKIFDEVKNRPQYLIEEKSD